MPNTTHVPRAVLSSLDMESLAAAVRLRGRDDPGMRFARLGVCGNAGKHAARLRARDALLGEDLRSFLTMPGLYFAFEWLLLQKRERGRVMRFDERGRCPERTYITAIEREPEIYRAAVRYMPAAREAGHLKVLTPVSGARYSMMSSHITRYHQMTFESFAKLGVRTDGAFLDFCGPLTAKRCAAIGQWWRGSNPQVLVCCAMQARFERGWDKERAYEELLQACPGSRVTDDYSYGQFRQVVVERL